MKLNLRVPKRHRGSTLVDMLLELLVAICIAVTAATIVHAFLTSGGHAAP